MAKACAYLCLQCLYVDGFGEFGEKLSIGTNQSFVIVIIELLYQSLAVILVC